ncbi:hypothetical protein [Nostoc sp.]|uniref:hypothetical protein n=1 Tax=Nostoc sp. TaxID=1180 RepID=UPI002FF6B293
MGNSILDFGLTIAQRVAAFSRRDCDTLFAFANGMATLRDAVRVPLRGSKLRLKPVRVPLRGSKLRAASRRERLLN